MVPHSWRRRTPALLAAALLLATAMAPAQTPGGGAKADALNPQAEVPALRHDSALARYPLQCSAGQERSGMQRALALGETGADTFRSAWNDIRPAAPLTVDDLRQRSG